MSLSLEKKVTTLLKISLGSSAAVVMDPTAARSAHSLSRGSLSTGLIIVIVLFGVYLPLMGLSLVAVLLMERFLLHRIPAACHWLGLPAL